MLESLYGFFSSGPFIPHGHCYLWNPTLVWLQILSNGVIGFSYVAISTTLVYLVYRLREAIPFRAMYVAFGAFIVLCGLTHFFDIYLIWTPMYWLDGSLRAVTALVSAGTALLLPPLIPHAQLLARGAKTIRERGIQLEAAVNDLETLYQKTKELEQLKSQFFANVSHELRTPLALIIGPVEKHLASGNLTPDQRRDFEIALRNAWLLDKHVDDLLDAARLEAGKMKAEYTSTDVAQLVRVTAANFEGLAAERGIFYSVDAPSTFAAQIDADKVQRILLNLLSNAFKFTPANGRVACKLIVGDERVSKTMAISVADTGPGIPLEQRGVIFDRFRQLDGSATRKVGGTGLGLAIAKEFVELHGGRISVDDAKDGGSLFIVELPRSAPPGVEIKTAAEDAGGQRAKLASQALIELRQRVDTLSSPRDMGKPVVLVVEDNSEMNRFICETLAPEYQTESAFDGQAGLEKSMVLKPDLILTDIMMPVMTGDEMVRQLRLRPEMQGIPIILLTAKADDELRIKMLRQGAQDYLTKPFSTEELNARVGNLITLKRTQDFLRKAKTTVESANRELEAFSYSVSHDLRAPLRGLDGFSQMLLDDYSDRLDSKGKDYLQRIRAAAQRMARLIDDLLALSRVTRQELRYERMDLSGMVRVIVERLQEAEPDRHVEIVVPEELMVRADPRLLQVALENLLGNAWKFTRKRALARIEVGCQLKDGESVFFVRDNGAGFNMEYASKLFAAFQRLHTEREFEGTGIGLATVQRIVHRHGGRIWAEAVVDGGATFYFNIPLASHTGPEILKVISDQYS